MGMIKDVCKMVVATTVMTLTACKVTDTYNKYAHNEVEKAKLKEKINNINIHLTKPNNLDGELCVQFTQALPFV